jgi:hypothetical protein
MRLNTLKAELSKWKEHHKPKIEKPPVKAVEAVEVSMPPKFFVCRPREKVAGGDILWKPVDRAAAMLLVKAPWWEHPPNNIIKKQQV